ADTVKGKGVSFMEGKAAWHGKPIPEADLETALKELGGAR
ncbi:MAG: transketolase, partial [Clostridiales bacterium]|nr:transketolase [Clostridiales bacterium]